MGGKSQGSHLLNETLTMPPSLANHQAGIGPPIPHPLVISLNSYICQEAINPGWQARHISKTRLQHSRQKWECVMTTKCVQLLKERNIVHQQIPHVHKLPRVSPVHEFLGRVVWYGGMPSSAALTPAAVAPLVAPQVSELESSTLPSVMPSQPPVGLTPRLVQVALHPDSYYLTGCPKIQNTLLCKQTGSRTMTPPRLYKSGA